VKRNQARYQIPLQILSYRDLYGWTMDEIVAKIGVGRNCAPSAAAGAHARAAGAFCGVFRRQALDRGAALVGADKIVTGHNADDIAETVLMNRASLPLLPPLALTAGAASAAWRRTATAAVRAHRDGGRRADPALQAVQVRLREGDCLVRACGAAASRPCPPSPPTRGARYAYFRRLDFFSTECTYAPQSYRGHAREFLKDLESVRPRAILGAARRGAQRAGGRA
jgi:cytoplasmic tRNA 2-thiolation protein 1